MERSPVILNEVERGTSTYDGLTIAQATMNKLHDVAGCHTLSATHFHELADAMLHAACMAMTSQPNVMATCLHLQGHAGAGRTVVWP